MIFMCSITSLNGAMSFMRSWLVMVAGTVRMHTMALRLTSSVNDVILLQGTSGKQLSSRHKQYDFDNIRLSFKEKADWTHLVLYKCMIPWTISTEGFPLKKEM